MIQMKENGITNGVEKKVLESLRRSRLFRDMEYSYCELTGLPMALSPKESFQLALHGHRKESPLCRCLAQTKAACAGCLRTQHQLCQQATKKTTAVCCPVGLMAIAAPILMNGQCIGYLQSGQARVNGAGRGMRAPAMDTLSDWGVRMDQQSLTRFYQESHKLSRSKFASAMKLLELFSGQLSAKAEQLLLQAGAAESKVVRRGRDFVAAQYREPISLGDVSRASHSSLFYFCKLFKRETGMSFTRYLGRYRVGKAKELLAQPGKRISEVAFEIGFQSLPHFNRVFKRETGKSPSEYRNTLVSG